jgi:hypothetical protein
MHGRNIIGIGDIQDRLRARDADRRNKVERRTREVMAKFCGSALLGAGLVATISCGGPISRVTHTQLRGLRVGMSTAEVEGLIGPPATTLPGDRGPENERPQVDMVWNYATDGFVDTFRAVRLRLELSKGTLVYATSYHRQEDDSTPELFTLNTDGRIEESKDIEKWFRP